VELIVVVLLLLVVIGGFGYGLAVLYNRSRERREA
jgi:hypothetical protein